jgi:hypothetical protein
MRTSRIAITMMIAASVMSTAFACASGGGPIDLSKLPPVVISLPAAPAADVPPTAAPKPRATLAFQVVDQDTGEPITSAIVTVAEPGKLIDQTAFTGNSGDKPIAEKQVNSIGYAAFELDGGGVIYAAMFVDPDYATVVRRFQLGDKPTDKDGEGNRQFTVRMKNANKPTPPPAPPVIEQPPASKPPVVVAPPVVVSPLEEAAGWSDEQWRGYLMPLLKRNGELVNDASMKIARPDVVARGADFQNGWRGDLRPRIFLPVPGCPPATRADVPECSYNRTFDFGQYGEPWQWIKR